MIYALDIETTGLSWHDDELIGVAICERANINSAIWYPKKRVAALMKWLSEYQIPVMCWNGLFDIGKLTYDYPQYPLNFVCDVAVLAQMADNSNSSPGFGLKPCIRKYLGYETVEDEIVEHLVGLNIGADKDNFRQFLSHVPEEMTAKYCKYDVYYTYALYEYLPNFIKVDTENWMYLFIQEVYATVEAIIDGLDYDRAGYERLIVEYQQKLEEVFAKFQADPELQKYITFMLRRKHYDEQIKRFEKSKTGKIKKIPFDEWVAKEKNQFNVASNTQLTGIFQEQGLFFDWDKGEFDYPEVSEKTKNPVLDINHIGLYGKGGEILEEKSNLKFVIDRMKCVIEETAKATGRWHPDYNLLGTKSGRIATSGANMLAFPVNEKEVAGRILSGDNETFIAVDFRSLEPCVQAHLSGDAKLTYAIATGVGKKPYWKNGTLWIDDIYLLNISEQKAFADQLDVDLDLWMEDDEAVKKKNKLVRNLAKGVYLSTGYGAQVKTVRKLCIKFTKHQWTIKEIKPIVQGFWASFPGLLMLKQDLEKEVRTEGYFVTEFGFPLTFKSTSGNALCTPMHTCLNRMVQSTAAGLMKLFISIVMKNKPCWMRIAIPDWHDAMTVKVPDDKVEEGKELINGYLAELNKTLDWEFPLILSMSTGKSLYATKE